MNFLQLLIVTALIFHPAKGVFAQRAKANCVESLQKLQETGTSWIPANQPSNRHKGYPDVALRKPDLPLYLGQGIKKLTRHGIVLGPTKEFEAAFNPAAFVAKDPKDAKEKVFLVVRGEKQMPNSDWKRKSLPYLAVSEDGIHFDWVSQEPLFLPTELYNRVGGVEDPRYLDLRKQPYQDPKDGKLFDGAILYTAFDGNTARVAFTVFNHQDLSLFREKGPLFPDADVKKNPLILENPVWNKSPAAIQFEDPKTKKLRNILYVGEGNSHEGGIMALEADTPFNWKWPKNKKPVITSRAGFYDQNLVEPAFQPVIAKLPKKLSEKTGQKLGIYVTLHGDSPPRGYQLGYRIFSLEDPTGKPIYESDGSFFGPEEPWEIEGQVGKVVFASGSVEFKGKRFIYYGAADKYVGCASADTE